MAPRSPAPSSPFLVRFAVAIVIVACLLTPIVLVGAVRAMRVHANDIRQWFPRGFEAAEVHDWFSSHFGVDEMLVISWDGATIENKDVYRFQQALESTQFEKTPVFSEVTSGPQLLQNLIDLGLTQAAGRARLEGLAIGPDGATTCVIAFPSAAVQAQRKEIVQRVHEIARDRFGIAEADLKVGGPTADGAAVDIESKRSLDQFMWYTVLAVFVLAWIRMRDFRMAVVVIGFALFCAGVSLAILHYTGGKMNLTMVMLPTLTFILGVSGCVHMANYYRSAVLAGERLPPAEKAMRDGGAPVAMASITTAIGLISLATSQVLPIRQFGIYSALGVVFSLPVILLLFPAVLHLFYRPRAARWISRRTGRQQRQRETGQSRQIALFVNWLCRYHWWVTLPSLVAMVAMAIGISQLKASVKIQNRFARQTTIIQNYEWLESRLGPLVPMEIILRIPSDAGLSPWEQLQIVSVIRSGLERTTAINASLSAATFKPPLPRKGSFRGEIERQLIVNEWEKDVGRLEKSRLLKRLDGENLWRISARVAALNDLDYGDFLDLIQRNVDRQIAFIGRELGKELPVTSVITGSIPLVYQAQHQILLDLLVSFVTAFVFITLVLVWVLKSFRAGLIAMIPNVFPPIMVFGAMGWLGVPIEIGSVMTASVALGIAVDDTVHFLTWYRRGFKHGKSRYKSIQFAFHHCSRAMIDTTLICGLGVAPFLLSVFMPTVRFSRMMLILLTTALAGDLILLPAILAGPAGVLFRRARKLFGKDRKYPRQGGAG